jgi:hypothetical protein
MSVEYVNGGHQATRSQRDHATKADRRSHLDDLAASLAGRSDQIVTRTASGLSIGPNSKRGFHIALQQFGSGCYATFGGCETDFDDVELACAWASRAVTASYCLRIARVGDQPYEWSIEPRNGVGTSLSYGTRKPIAWPWPFDRADNELVLGFEPT